MKKLLLILLFPITTFAQEKVDFKVLNDNPNHVSDRLINAYISFNYGKNSNISVGVGADGIWKLKDKIEVIGDVSYSPGLLIPFSGTHLELGGTYHLSQKSKIKDTKVVIKWSDT